MGSDLKINNKLQDYIQKFGLKLHPTQREIINYNNSLGEAKRMQISISQCHFLHLVIKISNVKNILEIGTFTGLSTLSMALALPNTGKIISLDKNNRTNAVANKFFIKAKQKKKISTIIKPAIESLKDFKKNTFDLIFIDADKMNYKNYYESSILLIKKGGLIIVDNVLWYGEVIEEKNDNKITLSIKDFNNHVANDKRVENLILPLGDGMTICRKI